MPFKGIYPGEGVRVSATAPVVAIDLDGTLGEYHDHFLWFARLYTQDDALFMDWRPEHEGEFSEALGLPKALYRDIKLAYRQGGMKRCLPAFPGARRAVQNIRECGVQVWITTTRPYMRLDNIDPDTQFWLKRNVGRVDGVVYGEDKYMDLADIVGQDRILGAIDDLPENINHARQLGINAALRVGEHNAWWTNGRRVPQGVRFINACVDMYYTVQNWKVELEAKL